jgi:hypothetical protein
MSGGSGSTSHPDAGSMGAADASDSAPPPCIPKGGALTGCAAMVPASIFAKSCSAASCHNPAVNQGGYAAYGLDLTSPGVALRLYNVIASENLPTTSYKLIDPLTPETSYVLLKVKMSTPPIGTQMPSMATKLTAAQQQCLHDWVIAEAANCGRL